MLVKVATAVLFIGGLAMVGDSAVSAAGCGPVPPTPPTPPGCKGKLAPVCQCDQKGQCQYVFQCVVN